MLANNMDSEVCPRNERVAMVGNHLYPCYRLFYCNKVTGKRGIFCKKYCNPKFGSPCQSCCNEFLAQEFQNGIRAAIIACKADLRIFTIKFVVNFSGMEEILHYKKFDASNEAWVCNHCASISNYSSPKQRFVNESSGMSFCLNCVQSHFAEYRIYDANEHRINIIRDTTNFIFKKPKHRRRFCCSDPRCNVGSLLRCQLYWILEQSAPRGDEAAMIEKENLMYSSPQTQTRDKQLVRKEIESVRKALRKYEGEEDAINSMSNFQELQFLEREIQCTLRKIEQRKLQLCSEREFVDEGKLCMICYTNPRDVLVLPCRHFLLCSACFDDSKNRLTKCPLCRGEILKNVKVLV